jgi:hypothetical protein
LVGSMVYLIGTWWWTSFIFLAAFIMAIIIIHYVNRARDQRIFKEGI